MKKISAVIITYNEEKNIGICLESLRNVANEIIVVDSYSSDNTVDICRKKGAFVIQEKWQGYSKMKNFGNSQAKYEYILSVDADEVISDVLESSIIKVKQNCFEGIYEFNRLTNYCGKWINHCGWYPDKKIRLFPESIAKWVGDYVHEALVFEGNPKKSFLKGDLLHYSYHDIGEHMERVQKYSDLHAKELFSSGKKIVIPRLIFGPIFKFLKTYIIKLGFIDGYYGFIISLISAYAVLLKYIKLCRIIHDTESSNSVN